MLPFQPMNMGGSSYIPRPPGISDKHTVVSVKNLRDDMCFKWTVPSALFLISTHANCLSNYVPHENAIDCTSLRIPVDPKLFSYFERDNPTIAIHCIAYNESCECFSTFCPTCTCALTKSVYSC